VRDEYGLDWDGFAEALGATPPGNDGALMLPWFEPEITPPVASVGLRRLNLDPRNTPANVRAVVEAQMMAMANHCAWMDVDVEAIHATGGASANRAILQVMADVFGADVYQFESANSACLGAALCAWHADEAASAAPRSWDEIVEAAARPAPASRIQPRAEHVETYRELRRRHADFEREALR
jgi:xylulokinase